MSSNYAFGRQYRRKYPKSWNSRQAVADRKMGETNEVYLGKFLKKWFPKNNFARDNTGWNVLDFSDDLGKIKVELKSRRINKEKYPTIMIGKNKYNAMIKYMKKGYIGYFLFKFTDKLCIYEVPKNLPQDISFARGGTNKRGCDEYSECMYIPTKYLKDCYDYTDYDDYIQKLIENK